MTATLYRKAVAYLRVSTDEQADKGLGLEAQRTAIEAAATGLGVRIVSWHSDEGLSGALDIEARPGLRAAVDSLRRGWVLLIAESSRLARDPDIAGEVRMQVRRKRAAILSSKTTENGGDDAVGMMTRRMITEISCFECGAMEQFSSFCSSSISRVVAWSASCQIRFLLGWTWVLPPCRTRLTLPCSAPSFTFPSQAVRPGIGSSHSLRLLTRHVLISLGPSTAYFNGSEIG